MCFLLVSHFSIGKEKNEIATLNKLPNNYIIRDTILILALEEYTPRLVFKVVSSYKALSDNELIQLLKSDDELALSELYLRYWYKLLVVACNRFNEPQEAEEVVQDIFCKLWLHRKDLELKYSLSTYLSIAVKYRIINLMDRRYRKRNKEMLLPDFSAQTSPSAEEYLFEKELQLQIDASIKQLPEKCRIVFTLSREQGLTYKQISQELGISEKTVEAHMSKALKDIRSNLTIVVPMVVIFCTQNQFH